MRQAEACGSTGQQKYLMPLCYFHFVVARLISIDLQTHTKKVSAYINR